MIQNSLGIIIALVLAGIAVFGSVFGSRLVLWIALGCGFLSGIVFGIVQNGFPQGVSIGACYGTIFTIIFASGGLARYYRRRGKSKLDDVKQAQHTVYKNAFPRREVDASAIQALISLIGIIISGIMAPLLIASCWWNSCKEDYAPIYIAFVLLGSIVIFTYVFLLKKVKGKTGLILLSFFIVGVMLIISRILHLI